MVQDLHQLDTHNIINTSYLFIQGNSGVGPIIKKLIVSSKILVRITSSVSQHFYKPNKITEELKYVTYQTPQNR